MKTDSRRAEDDAITWRIRLRDADGDTWLGFARWIEADPANADAYAAVSAVDVEAPEMLEVAPALPRIIIGAPASPMAVRPPRGRPVRYGLGLSAAAAAIVAAFVVSPVMRSPFSVVATGPGQPRSIVLADGTRIDMNGNTRLALDSRHSRSVRMISGEASFTVHHDAATPFEVLAGDARLRDVGTVFNVVREHGAVEVAVASGAVLYNPDREHVQLAAGDALHDPDGRGVSVRNRVDPATVGDWRSGRLVFTHATLADVAAAITRSTAPVTVAPTIASRSFDGVIIVRGDRESLFRRLGPLLGVRVNHVGATVQLLPIARAGG